MQRVCVRVLRGGGFHEGAARGRVGGGGGGSGGGRVHLAVAVDVDVCWVLEGVVGKRRVSEDKPAGMTAGSVCLSAIVVVLWCCGVVNAERRE